TLLSLRRTRRLLQRLHINPYKLQTSLGALVLVAGCSIIAYTVGTPEDDTHVLDGAAISCICVAGVALYHGLVMIAQRRCERIDEGGEEVDESGEETERGRRIKAAVTAATQYIPKLPIILIPHPVGILLGAAISTAIFRSHVVDTLTSAGFDLTESRTVAMTRSVPNTTPSEAAAAASAIADGLKIIHRYVCLPIVCLAVVLILVGWGRGRKRRGT
ncbi:hypothetical protein HK104_007282, partial [Borealophlyctis nickersoniae]